MILLNLSEKSFNVEDFDFYVERVEDADKNVLYLVKGLEDLFPNITRTEWENRQFCLIPPKFVSDNALLMIIDCVEQLSRLSNHHVKILFYRIHDKPVSFNF